MRRVCFQAIAIMPCGKTRPTSWLIVTLLNGSATPSHGMAVRRPFYALCALGLLKTVCCCHFLHVSPHLRCRQCREWFATRKCNSHASHRGHGETVPLRAPRRSVLASEAAILVAPLGCQAPCNSQNRSPPPNSR
jgi:hypothetical protein